MALAGEHPRLVWTGPAGVSDVVASLQRAPGSTIIVLTTHFERGDHIDSVFLARLGDQRGLLGTADESRIPVLDRPRSRRLKDHRAAAVINLSRKG